MPFLLVDDRMNYTPRVEALSDRDYRRLMELLLSATRSGIIDPSVQWIFDERLAKIRFGTARRKWNRLKLWRQFGGICHICGDPVPANRFHVDHVVPLSRGGKDEWDNLDIAHPLCNLQKGSWLLEELL